MKFKAIALNYNLKLVVLLSRCSTSHLSLLATTRQNQRIKKDN